MHADAQFTGALVIDLDALARNFRKVRGIAAPAECAAVVKANAYGLGLAPIAKRLLREGCRRFFVATLAEGQELRALTPDAAIYVFEGVLDGQAGKLLEASLTPVLNSLEQVARWAGQAESRAAILHIDTGISRLGMAAKEVDALALDHALLQRLQIEYVLTHFACADEPDHGLNRAQLRRFDALRGRLPPAPTSIANSAAIFIDADHRGDLVRPGIALYGGNPFSDRDNPMERVVTLKARILQIREVDEGLTVGYGATYGVGPPARLAVLGVGYADGYPRALSNLGVASVGGRRVPVVGRVSMDLICVDVSALPASEVRTGDWVELFGADVTLDEVAEAAGTISYEILTRLGPRLHREYLG
ncbi:MAG TPA: alanine racemase [Gammaproteobacteria bacterium]|nr:alanine racemase [Gammaproteobacteria bacterium]